jgi:hypothetical protein
MKLVRNYSADEISALVEILRTAGDVSASKLDGMEMLVHILKQNEGMTKLEFKAKSPSPFGHYEKT